MENKTRVIAVSLLGLLIVIAGGLRTNAASTSPLKGAWRAVETGGGQNRAKIVGLAIFMDTHYSIMYFDATNERPDIANVAQASADDMRALWNGWVANTGTYEMNGDLVTIHPSGAKNPVVMKAGANEVYRFQIDGDTLSWTQQRNARGVVVTGAPTTKFVREE
jgi:hypothetical protein